MSTMLQHATFCVLMVFAVHTGATTTIDSPCGADWVYSATSGKCYKFMTTRKKWDEAGTECKFDTTLASNKQDRKDPTTLAVILSAEDMAAVAVAAKSNREEQWIGAKKVGDTYQWSDSTPLASSPYWREASGTGDCVSLRIGDEFSGGNWITTFKLAPADCAAPRGFFCEYEANKCGTTALKSNGFNTNSMELKPNRTTVMTKGTVACKEGFYRDSDLVASTATVKNGLLPNQFLCTGTKSPDGNPRFYNHEMKIFEDSVEVCKAIACSAPNFNVSNVERQPTVKNEEYPFNASLDVNCTLGFVNYQDPTSTTSAMRCKQSRRKPNMGNWVPGDLTPCIGVRCNQTQLLEMKPFRGQIIKAVNKKTQVQYDGRYQKSELNKYDNVVTIRCDDGYFFDDRSPEKTALCGLKEGSRTVGEWKGYQGSKLPIPPKCEEVSCRYQEVQPQESHNFEKQFVIRHINGTLEKRETHTGDDYAFNVVIRFWCQSGYETANQGTDQNITCGPQGSWQPQMTGCIERTAHLDTGNRKHYEPEPQDAPAAKQVGAVVIVIMVLFLGLIVILDLSTLARDIKIMRHNLRHLRDRMHYRKQAEQ